MDYKVRDLPADQLDEAKPRNILEEIVWYKAKEIEVWKDRVPLQMLMVRHPFLRKPACPAQQIWAPVMLSHLWPPTPCCAAMGMDGGCTQA